MRLLCPEDRVNISYYKNRFLIEERDGHSFRGIEHNSLIECKNCGLVAISHLQKLEYGSIAFPLKLNIYFSNRAFACEEYKIKKLIK